MQPFQHPPTHAFCSRKRSEIGHVEIRQIGGVLALVLAIMVFAMSVPFALADDPEHTTADNYTLTINNLVKDHQYSIYQIFDGSKANNNSQVQYVEANGYAENTVYYEKKGADYYPKAVTDATAYGTITATTTLYIRTGDSALGDVVWGSSITTAGKKALYTEYGMSVADTDIDKIENIRELLKKIAGETDATKSESDKAVRFANVFFTTGTDGSVTIVNADRLGNAVATTGILTADGNHTFNNLASGYYIVNDEWKGASTAVNGVDYSIARIAVQVVGNTVINNKADKVVADKKIKTSAELINEKANEVGIGRTVEYVVTETVPNYDGYNYYYFVLCDTLAEGLTFDPESVVVKVDGTPLTKKNVPVTGGSDGKGYFVYYDKSSNSSGITTTSTGANVEGVTFVIAFEDIMKFEVGKPIEVTYNANVNYKAITGVDPNTNKIFVNYSNHPESSDKYDTDGHPGIPANRTDVPVGKTPDRWTDTYTTKLTINKVDENGNALKDVEFTLTGKSKDVVVNTEEVYELDAAGEYYMLKDGTYTKTAPSNVATIEETKDNSGWVEIESGDTYSGDDIRVVGGKKYRPFVIATDQAKTRYVIVEGNAATYASTTLRYRMETITTASPADTKTDEYEVTRVGKTDASGNLVFSQLGAGTYTLSETKVRPGYNDIQDITFTITCELPAQATVVAGTEKAKWTTTVTSSTGVITEVTTGEGTDKKGTGNFTMTIVNNKGVELPSTGGIGTTIFYVAGSILVLAAAILLITKRRMGAED